MFWIPRNRPKVRLPKKVRLEASTLCQLNCLGCYMRLGNYCGFGAGYLSFGDFEAFLEKHPFVREIELSNSGEIFLNPDLLKIIRHAYEKGIKLCAYNGVNLNSVSDEVLEALVSTGFEVLNVSIDGASQETYSQYRQRGNFDKVIANIRRINDFKKKYGSDKPYLKWQYIILPSSDSISEIRKAKKLARELGMYLFFQKDWNGHVPENVAEVEMETGLSYNEVRQLNSSHERWRPCLDMWRNPQINWDGRMFGCCCNSEKSFGVNVFSVGLEKALASGVVWGTMEMLKGGKIRKDSPCHLCGYMPRFGEYIREDEIDEEWFVD